MTDLLKDFFKRDLTEAEERRLGELLSSSQDESLRFAKLAQQAYRRTGLPDEGGSDWRGIFSPLMLVVLLKALLLLTAMGFSGYFLYSILHCAKDPAVLIRKSEPDAPKKISLLKPAHAKEPLKSLPVEALAKPAMVDPTAYNHTKQYGGLDIIVDQKTSGLLTVRALDNQNREIRVLFAGIVKPGKWDFVWDGKMESGQTAAPGTYKVEVQSGKDILTKDVIIHGTALTQNK